MEVDKVRYVVNSYISEKIALHSIQSAKHSSCGMVDSRGPVLKVAEQVCFVQYD